MPIYEYVCDDCKARYEKIVSASNGKAECPKCGSKHSTIQFSTFAAHRGNGGSFSNNASASASDESASGGACGCTPHSCGCH